PGVGRLVRVEGRAGRGGGVGGRLAGALVTRVGESANANDRHGGEDADDDDRDQQLDEGETLLVAPFRLLVHYSCVPPVVPLKREALCCYRPTPAYRGPLIAQTFSLKP